MAFEMRPNSGSLFANDRKTEEKHPSHKGKALIDGREYWISAWVRGGDNGKKRFFSLSFEPIIKDPAQQAPQQPRNQSHNNPPRPGSQRVNAPRNPPREAPVPQDDLDDSIPF